MKKDVKYFTYVFTIILLIIFVKQINNYYKISNCSRYTIGFFDKYAVRGRSNHVVYFNYKISNLAYCNYVNLEKNEYNMEVIYLRYACENPEIIEGIWDRKVDSIHLKNLPPDGWDKLPD